MNQWIENPSLSFSFPPLFPLTLSLQLCISNKLLLPFFFLFFFFCEEYHEGVKNVGKLFILHLVYCYCASTTDRLQSVGSTIKQASKRGQGFLRKMHCCLSRLLAPSFSWRRMGWPTHLSCLVSFIAL